MSGGKRATTNEICHNRGIPAGSERTPIEDRVASRGATTRVPTTRGPTNGEMRAVVEVLCDASGRRGRPPPGHEMRRIQHGGHRARDPGGASTKRLATVDSSNRSSGKHREAAPRCPMSSESHHSKDPGTMKNDPQAVGVLEEPTQSVDTPKLTGHVLVVDDAREIRLLFAAFLRVDGVTTTRRLRERYKWRRSFYSAGTRQGQRPTSVSNGPESTPRSTDVGQPTSQLRHRRRPLSQPSRDSRAERPPKRRSTLATNGHPLAKAP